MGFSACLCQVDARPSKTNWYKKMKKAYAADTKGHSQEANNVEGDDNYAGASWLSDERAGSAAYGAEIDNVAMSSGQDTFTEHGVDVDSKLELEDKLVDEVQSMGKKFCFRENHDLTATVRDGLTGEKDFEAIVADDMTLNFENMDAEVKVRRCPGTKAFGVKLRNIVAYTTFCDSSSCCRPVKYRAKENQRYLRRRLQNVQRRRRTLIDRLNRGN